MEAILCESSVVLPGYFSEESGNRILKAVRHIIVVICSCKQNNEDIMNHLFISDPI